MTAVRAAMVRTEAAVTASAMGRVSYNGLKWLREQAGRTAVPAHDPSHTWLVSQSILRVCYAIWPEGVRQAAICERRWRVLSHADTPYGSYRRFDTKTYSKTTCGTGNLQNPTG